MNRIGLLLAVVLFSMQLNAASGRFVTISDLHFNPFFDPTLVADLKAKPASEWSTIFASTTKKGFGDYGGSEETNDALFASVLADAARRLPDADFVLFTGDIIAHGFQKRYGVAAPTPEYEAFVLRSVNYVLRRITETFPNKPVYFTLGNNDAYCGDYKVAPEGRFLGDTAKLITGTLLHDPADGAAVAASYAKGGYYSAALPEGQGRIVAVNTILFSRHYEEACGPKLDYDPAAVQFQWLENALKVAKSKGEPVWLLLHVPPGVDVFATLKGVKDGRVESVTPMWQPRHLSRFLDLVRQYQTTIRAAFAGHTHMDNFRLISSKHEGAPAAAYVHTSPAVSPQFGNNPAYNLYSYDVKAFVPTDFEVYYLDIADRGEGGWQFEYDFARRYGVPSISVANLERIRASLPTDAERRAWWQRLYNVSHTATPAIDGANFKGYWCGMSRLTDAAFTDCYNAQ